MAGGLKKWLGYSYLLITLATVIKSHLSSDEQNPMVIRKNFCCSRRALGNTWKSAVSGKQD